MSERKVTFFWMCVEDFVRVKQEIGNLRRMFLIVREVFFLNAIQQKKDAAINVCIFGCQSDLNFIFSFRIISVELPDDARQFGIQFRWWQPYHSSQGEDVWAIDEIIMTSVLFNSISLDFTNLVEVTQSLGFYLGNVQPCCGHDWTLW